MLRVCYMATSPRLVGVLKQSVGLPVDVEVGSVVGNESQASLRLGVYSNASACAQTFAENSAESYRPIVWFGAGEPRVRGDSTGVLVGGVVRLRCVPVGLYYMAVGFRLALQGKDATASAEAGE